MTMQTSEHDPTDVQACAWRAALHALISARLAEPFAWGRNDCCLWAADAVLATTGIDHAAGLRGTYSTAAGAVGVLADLGGLEAVGAQAGAQIAPLMAAEGDIGLLQMDDREMLAVCCGPGWLAPTAAGLALCQLEDARMAWRVEHA
jgi:hypothetical protein